MIATYHPHLQWFTAVAALIVLGSFYQWTSRINQFYFFGRTVSPEFRLNAAARQIQAFYKKRMMAGIAFSIVMFGAPVTTFHLVSIFTGFLIGLLYQVLFFHTTFAACHRKTGRALAATPASGEQEPAARTIAVPMSAPSGPSALLLLLPPAGALASYAAAAALAHQGWSALANSVDVNGGATPLGLGCGLLFASTIMQLLLRYSARNRTPMARQTAAVGQLLGWVGAVVLAVTAFSVPLHHHLSKPAVRGFIGTLLALSAAYILYTWKRSERFEPPQAERSGDEHWRWGMYYYNPADPALMVQKRTGPGYTLNFANTFSWPIAAGVLGNFVMLFVLNLRR